MSISGQETAKWYTALPIDPKPGVLLLKRLQTEEARTPAKMASAANISRAFTSVPGLCSNRNITAFAMFSSQSCNLCLLGNLNRGAPSQALFIFFRRSLNRWLLPILYLILFSAQRQCAASLPVVHPAHLCFFSVKISRLVNPMTNNNPGLR